MGERVDKSALAANHDPSLRRRLQRCVAVLRRMVDDGWFVGHEDTIGMEVELDLVDPLGRARLVNDAVLERLGRTDMQHELGQFNVELNIAPRRSGGLRAAGQRIRPHRRARPAPSPDRGARRPDGRRRHAANPERRAADRRADLPQPALRVVGAAHARRSPPAVVVQHRRRPRAGGVHHRFRRPRCRRDQPAAAPAGAAGAVRRLLQRRPDDRRRASGGGRQLAVSARLPGVAGNPYSVVGAAA